MKELFKDIPNYEGFYQVSNLGNVMNYKRKTILKQNVGKRGYSYVVLCKNKTKKTATLHRLVLLSFTNNKLNKPCVNHINGIKEDNNLKNLEWCTYSENRKHALKNNLIKNISENHHNSKLSKKDVIEIRKMLGLKTQKQIAAKFKINQSTVSDIKNFKIRNYE